MLFEDYNYIVLIIILIIVIFFEIEDRGELFNFPEYDENTNIVDYELDDGYIKTLIINDDGYNYKNYYINNYDLKYDEYVSGILIKEKYEKFMWFIDCPIKREVYFSNEKELLYILSQR